MNFVLTVSGCESCECISILGRLLVHLHFRLSHPFLESRDAQHVENVSFVLKEGGQRGRFLCIKAPESKAFGVFLSKPINIAVTACTLFRGLSLSLSLEWCTHACVSSHPRPPPTSP